MIFLTVGTVFPFDRLVRAADEAVDKYLIDDSIFAQIGDSPYRPRNFEYTRFLRKSEYDCWVQKSTGVISHAGIGTITMALDRGKPLLVMPRQQRYGEVVNDHQVAFARRYELLRYLLVAYEANELPAKIEQLKSFVPMRREAQPQAMADRIGRFLFELSGARK